MIRYIFVVLFAFWGLNQASAQVVLLSGDYPDPSVLKDGDNYYMTHSASQYQPGFLIWHSTDLITWTPICRACSDWPRSAWAPDLQKVGDTYYIYFPANKTNWVITAKDIRGPWSDPIDLKLSGIDPGLVVTPDGERFLFTNRGRVTPLTSDGLACRGETIKVYDGWKYPEEWEVECACLESPKLIYHDGYYYMTSAQGGTAGPATSHMAVCARSKNIYGPWEESPYNPIVHTYSADEEWWSKGHGTIVEGPDGRWWVVYHAYRKGSYISGRYTLMEQVEWTDDGWFRVAKNAAVPEAIIAPELSDSFNSDVLSWQWMGWKEDITRHVSIKDGWLSLPGSGSSPSDGRHMMITALDLNYAIEVDVCIDSCNSSGGLLLMYNEQAFAGLASNGEIFTIYRNASEMETLANPLGNVFRIRIENRGGRLGIMVRKESEAWMSLASDIDVSEFHHNRYGGYFALRPSLYSSGNGLVQFRDFLYQPL